MAAIYHSVMCVFACVCLCAHVLPRAEFRRCAAEADHRDLQGGGAGMLGGSPERPGRQERGAQGRVEPPAETQRGTRSAGYRVLLLVTLLILSYRWQLLHQATVTFPVRLRNREWWKFEWRQSEMICAVNHHTYFYWQQQRGQERFCHSCISITLLVIRV